MQDAKVGTMEAQSGNMGRAVKHWMIAASAGQYHAMGELRHFLKLELLVEIQSTQLWKTTINPVPR
jgi:hypothetical protein